MNPRGGLNEGSRLKTASEQMSPPTTRRSTHAQTQFKRPKMVHPQPHPSRMLILTSQPTRPPALHAYALLNVCTSPGMPRLNRFMAVPGDSNATSPVQGERFNAWN